MSHSNRAAAALVLGILATSCGGKLEAVAEVDAAAPTATASAPAGAADYVIAFPGAQSQTFDVDRRSLARFSFDLAKASKDAAPEIRVDYTLTGAPVTGTEDPQVRLIGIDGMDPLCGAPLPPGVESAANLRLIPHDIVEMARFDVVFDLVGIFGPFPADVGVCYGTHASGGGWTWNTALVPIAFDSPWIYGGPDGVGHLGLPIAASKIDMVGVIFNENVEGLFLKKVTYTAVRSR